jgi:hypothetical protein
MNRYEMIVLVMVVIMIAGVMKARYRYQGAAPKTDEPEALRMREEIRTLKDRIAVLERIATDKGSALEREIEQLRDR